MIAFRSYFLDFRDKIEGFSEFEAADDEAALAHAQTLKEDRFAVEVWQGSRLVGRVGGDLDLTAAARGERQSVRS